MQLSYKRSRNRQVKTHFFNPRTISSGTRRAGRRAWSVACCCWWWDSSSGSPPFTSTSSTRTTISRRRPSSATPSPTSSTGPPRASSRPSACGCCSTWPSASPSTPAPSSTWSVPALRIAKSCISFVFFPVFFMNASLFLLCSDC